jgi:hypothetical protein
VSGFLQRWFGRSGPPPAELDDEKISAAQSFSGAVWSERELERLSRSHLRDSYYWFDVPTIIPMPAAAVLTTTVLIGAGAASGAVIPPVPSNCRGVIDFVAPYLSTTAAPGMVTDPNIARLLVAGDVIRWRLLESATPIKYFSNITTLLDPFTARGSSHGWAELHPGSVLSCEVDALDAVGVFDFIGIRLVGRFLPLRELRK